MLISSFQEISLKYLSENKIEFIISNGYAPIIKYDVLKVTIEKIINIHAASCQMEEEYIQTFGVSSKSYPQEATIHNIDENIDTGDILLTKEVTITDEDTLKTSLTKLMQAAEDLFLENVEDIINDRIIPKRQSTLNHSSFYHSRIVSENFIELLPNRWETNVNEVRKLGEAFSISKNGICNLLKEE